MKGLDFEYLAIRILSLVNTSNGALPKKASSGEVGSSGLQIVQGVGDGGSANGGAAAGVEAGGELGVAEGLQTIAGRFLEGLDVQRSV